MQPSQAVPTLLDRFESESFTAYPDPGSQLGQALAKKGLTMTRYKNLAGWHLLKGDPWTAGKGHTGPEVQEGLTITPEQSGAWFLSDIAHVAEGVSQIIAGIDVVAQCQFDAFCCFAFNEGVGAPDNHDKGLWGSTLMAKFRTGDVVGAAGQFDRWVFSGGKVFGGLVRRRKAERLLFEGRAG